MSEFLSSLLGALLGGLWLAGPAVPAPPRACPSCKSQSLSETGQGYTRTEPVGLEGADVMVHYREYRCSGCGDRCHFRAG